jgi:hypothetical protein
MDYERSCHPRILRTVPNVEKVNKMVENNCRLIFLKMTEEININAETV